LSPVYHFYLISARCIALAWLRDPANVIDWTLLQALLAEFPSHQQLAGHCMAHHLKLVTQPLPIPGADIAEYHRDRRFVRQYLDGVEDRTQMAVQVMLIAEDLCNRSLWQECLDFIGHFQKFLPEHSDVRYVVDFAKAICLVYQAQWKAARRFIHNMMLRRHGDSRNLDALMAIAVLAPLRLLADSTLANTGHPPSLASIPVPRIAAPAFERFMQSIPELRADLKRTAASPYLFPAYILAMRTFHPAVLMEDIMTLSEAPHICMTRETRLLLLYTVFTVPLEFGKSSSPFAMMTYDAFRRRMQELEFPTDAWSQSIVRLLTRFLSVGEA